MAGEITEFLKSHMESNLGNTGKEIFNKTMKKTPINANSTLGEVCDFILNVEKSMTVLYGKSKAHEVCLNLRTHAKEMYEKKPSSGLGQAEPEVEIIPGLENDINEFLKKNILPTEKDINDFAKYLIISGYTGDENQLTQQIMDKVKQKIKTVLHNQKINNEIDHFIDRFHSPTENDVKDFINYLKMMELKFDESTVLKSIERERLYRKFKAPKEVTEEEIHHEEIVNKFKKYVDSAPDAKALGETITSQNLGYLVKDSDSDAFSDDSLSQIIELTHADEDTLKDTLSQMGLGHMVKGK